MFKPRDTTHYFEQQTPERSGFENILPILLSIVGNVKGRKSSGTGSMVDTYLGLSQGEPPAQPTTVAPTPPVMPTSAPLGPLASLVKPDPFKSPAVKKMVRGCKIDPRTGKVV